MNLLIPKEDCTYDFYERVISINGVPDKINYLDNYYDIAIEVKYKRGDTTLSSYYNKRVRYQSFFFGELERVEQMVNYLPTVPDGKGVAFDHSLTIRISPACERLETVLCGFDGVEIYE